MPTKNSKKQWHFPVIVEQDEDGAYIVSIPSLKGCRSYGLTLDEAMKNITEAALLCLDDERPTPTATFLGVRDIEIVA